MATTITLRKLRSILKTGFGGVIKAGSHSENGEVCALELASVALDIPWTDSPAAVRSFDFRNINDIGVSDSVRTKHIMPVIVAYAGSLDWSLERQQAVAERIVVLTVNRLIADLPGLPESARQQCRDVKDTGMARAAAAAAEAAAWAAKAAAAAWAAAWAAKAAAAAWAAAAAAEAEAAEAAEAAAKAAAAAWAASAAAEAEKVFIIACQLWLDAAAI